ncbi:MAG: methyl-accepting chemotaxis protein [Myxococcales bacterium]
MTSSPVPDLRTLRSRLFWRMVALNLPTAVVAAYLLCLLFGMDGAQVYFSILTVLPPVFGVGMALQFLVNQRILAAALDRPASDPPGARLKRLLETPPRIVVSTLSGWGGGALAFGGLFALAYGGGLRVIVGSTLVGTFTALVPSVMLVMVAEDLLRPVVVDEWSRAPGTRADGSGPYWVRQRWFLPYAFVVALLSVIVFSGLALSTRFANVAQTVVQHIGERDAALAAVVKTQLGSLVVEALWPVAFIGVYLVTSFVIAGFALARRQRLASEAVERSLRSLVAGTPEPPSWVTTDEVGDLGLAAAQVALEMRHIFSQLRAMAEGDLRAEIQGDSGLLRAFRDSREGLLRLSEMMLELSRGELAARAAVSGDLGSAFGRLLASLQAIAEGAQKIAQGDLRLDVQIPGALGESLRRMTENLRTMADHSQQGSTKVAAIVVSLQAAASQLSTATSEQAAAITETANTVAEMAQTSAASADRAAELIKRGDSAASVVEEGGEASRAATDSTAAASETLARVATSSAALAERVQRIDGITETVGFLADQSSTLAINAAIEAARAGEAGKGFGVVAHEIRTLASDSRKAAAQIRELLGEIRERTRQVDASVSAGTKTVESCNRLVGRLGEIVHQLGVTVHDSVGLMRQVEGATRQHHTGVAQISQALTNMQRVSESIRDGARLLSSLSTQAHELSGSLQQSSQAYSLPERKAS